MLIPCSFLSRQQGEFSCFSHMICTRYLTAFVQFWFCYSWYIFFLRYSSAPAFLEPVLWPRDDGLIFLSWVRVRTTTAEFVFGRCRCFSASVTCWRYHCHGSMMCATWTLSRIVPHPFPPPLAAVRCLRRTQHGLWCVPRTASFTPGCTVTMPCQGATHPFLLRGKERIGLEFVLRGKERICLEFLLRGTIVNITSSQSVIVARTYCWYYQYQHYFFFLYRKQVL